jgi:hypothetical protein
MSVQAPPHADRPIEQVATHAPAAQTSPAPQAWPQAPQLAGSFPVSAQTSPHFSRGAQLAPQVPAAQTSPALQATSQAPQWAGSAPRSKQASPQAIWPALHPPPAPVDDDVDVDNDPPAPP